jgi:hypothetical protein
MLLVVANKEHEFDPHLIQLVFSESHTRKYIRASL